MYINDVLQLNSISLLNNYSPIMFNYLRKRNFAWNIFANFSFYAITRGSTMPLCVSYKNITLALLSNNQTGITSGNIGNHFQNYFLDLVEGLEMINEMYLDKTQII